MRPLRPTTAPRAPRRWATATPLAAVALLLAACSGGSEPADDAAPDISAIVEEPRFECTDPAGDVEDPFAPVGTTAFSEPAGIDLVSAVVDRGDDQLAISFTAAGDITSTTIAPAFILFRGQEAARQGAFEVQALRAEDGSWAAYLVDYRTNAGNRTRLDVPVTVEGDTLSLTVPIASLPPLTGTVLWTFGTFDGERATVGDLEATTTTTAPVTPTTEGPALGRSDLCTPFDDQASTTTAADDPSSTTTEE